MKVSPNVNNDPKGFGRHKKQWSFHMAPHKIRLFLGGNRTGKTAEGANETLNYAMGEHEGRVIKTPCEIWVASPSYELQPDGVQKAIANLIPPHWVRKINREKGDVWKTLELVNGSLITFKTYEQGAQKFQSAGKRFIWFDEEPPYDIYEECLVRQSAGIPLDIIITMTPVNGMSWVYTELYENPSENVYVEEVTWKDNPYLDPEQVEFMEKSLDEEAKAIRRDGKFVMRTGLVCNWFRREMIKEIPYPASTDNIWRIIDYGGNKSKYCVLWIGVRMDKTVYVYDGIYENDLDSIKLAELIQEREKDLGIRVHKCISDIDKNHVSILTKQGIKNIKEIEKNAAGEQWDEYRAEAMKRIADERKLTISNTLTTTDQNGKNVNYFMREAETLKWRERKTKDKTKNDKGKWDKETFVLPGSHYDCMDAFSYFCVEFIRSREEYKEPKRKRNRKKVRRLNPLINY